MKKQLAVFRRQRSRLKSRLDAVEGNIALSSGSGFMNGNPADTNLGAFMQFFPDANIKKLEQIEMFHRQIQSLLSAEFAEAKSELTTLIDFADMEIARNVHEIAQSGIPGRVYKAALGTYSAIENKMRALKLENDTYAKLSGLKERAKMLAAQLAQALAEQLHTLQHALNNRLDKIYTYVYGAARIAPEVSISDDGKSYSFETSKASGTNAANSGLIAFDLSVLELTRLPVLLHDSVLFNHVADASFGKVFERYAASKKQVFVTIDKERPYSDIMRNIIESSKVLELSDTNDSLFGQSWHKMEEAVGIEATETEAN